MLPAEDRWQRASPWMGKKGCCMVSGSSPTGKRGRFFNKRAAMRLAILPLAVSLLFLLVALLSSQGAFAQSAAPHTQQGALLSHQGPTPTPTDTPTDTP